MKRSVLILLMSVLILLTACRSKTPVLNDTFRSGITVSGGELDFDAQVECSPGRAVVEITSPATVAGIRYTYSGGELHLSCGGMDSVSDLGSFPPSSAPAILCETLSRLSEASYDTSKDDADVFRLKLDGGDVVITAEDGKLCTITADNSPYTVTFLPRGSD